MSTKNKILLIDDSQEAYEKLKESLGDYDLHCHCDPKTALEQEQLNDFDMCLISSDIAESEQLMNSISESLPILFIVHKNINNDLKARVPYFKFSALNEKYGVKLLEQHISSAIEEHMSQQEQQNELTEVTNAVLSLQNDNAKLQDINRFLQHSFFCPDINALCEQFFSVINSFGTTGTLYIHSDKHDFFISDDGENKPLNNNILTMLKDESRIFQFGYNRAVFNWNCASLLVNKLGSDVDNLAMLMDGFEIGFNAIKSVEEFDQVLKDYRAENNQLNVNITKIVEDLAIRINEQLALFGAETSLTLEQEEALIQIADESRMKVDDLFNTNMNLDEQLSRVMQAMRTQKENSSSTTVEEDDIEFF